MYDSYGDGWNGNTWTATSINNPANSFSFTLNTGSSGSSSFVYQMIAIILNVMAAHGNLKSVGI